MIPLLRFFWVLLATCNIVGGVASAQGQIPAALKASVIGDQTSTRFFTDFTGPVSVKTFYQDGPHRLIIDLGEVDLGLSGLSALEALEPRGLISDIQFGPVPQGRSRIVLSLAKPAEIVRASMQKRIDEDHYRLLIDLEATSQDRFATLLNAQELVLLEKPATAGTGSKRPEKTPGRFIIVIDPGHGGIDGGASGKLGLKEKHVVLEFARELQSQISLAGPFDVKLTRGEDVFVSLKDRLEFGRKVQADLFISVHADSLEDRSVRGSTIYTLSKKASDNLARRLAEAENKVDLLAGLPVMDESEAIFDILVDLTTRETKVFSRQFSRILMTNLGKEVRLIKNPVRSAAFGVLKAPDVPGVLLELGYLSNEEDEKLMMSDEWRNRAARAVTRSVSAFFEPRLQ